MNNAAKRGECEWGLFLYFFCGATGTIVEWISSFIHNTGWPNFLARLASKWEPARVTYISQTLYRGVVAGYIFVQGIQNWPVQPNLPARNRAKKNVDPTGNYQLIRLVNSVALYVKRAHLQLKRKTNDFPFSSLLIAWGSNLIWLWYCEELLWFITNCNAQYNDLHLTGNYPV